MQGTIVAVNVTRSEVVRRGQTLVIIESMKMEHPVDAPSPGEVVSIAVAEGETVGQGELLVELVTVTEDSAAVMADEAPSGPEEIRPDLAAVRERHEMGADERRQDAVARRHETGHRTARENVADLCDPGSFAEYGPLAIAAQRRRRSLEELIERTPADGLIGGIGRVNGHQTIVMSYDYTVLAGTQGFQNHRKKDRLFELAERLRLPVVFFTEGGGGRPGDTDAPGVSGLDCLAFLYFAQLSGLVPLVGIASGRCFAGNAAILGCCDVVIATSDANIGMGGPAMIEGGGLGVYRPEDIGPASVQVPNGVIDVAVADESEAVAVAKKYLSYFQGPPAPLEPLSSMPRASTADPATGRSGPGTDAWTCADQRALRSAIPENRLRAYDIRAVVSLLADTGSVLELRRDFGVGMVTALIRVEGRPMGLVANNPSHLGGAIDADGADKAARFLQLCDSFDLPVLTLCDTPGIMVGPDAEKTALVRHVSRMFVTGANLSVPLLTIVVRKGYGLGAQAMAGASFKAPLCCISWPTGEFGGMGLEGAVRLGFRRELEALAEGPDRDALFDELVAKAYEYGQALNSASHFEIDDVIDPADSRRWITTLLDAAPPCLPRSGKKRPHVDTW